MLTHWSYVFLALTHRYNVTVYIFQTFLPTRLTTPLIVSIIFPMALCASLITHAMPCLMAGTWWAVLLLCISVIWTVSCFAMLLVYEQNTNFTTFKVGYLILDIQIYLAEIREWLSRKLYVEFAARVCWTVWRYSNQTNFTNRAPIQYKDNILPV